MVARDEVAMVSEYFASIIGGTFTWCLLYIWISFIEALVMFLDYETKGGWPPWMCFANMLVCTLAVIDSNMLASNWVRVVWGCPW
jgi:hypothetical protein